MDKMQMIDVHNHILFDVDDGAKTIEASLEMIHYAIAQGVDTLVCTPHLLSRATRASRDIQLIHFKQLQAVTKALDVTLFLGGEIHYKSHLEIDYDAYTVGPQKTLLLEFSTYAPEPIEAVCYNLIKKGYQVILAHVERYQSYLSFDDYVRIKRVGVYLQVNATSITGYEAHKHKRLIKKLFKHHLIDLIATDAHDMKNRKPDLSSSYRYLAKKLDPDYLQKLYYDNAYQLLFMEGKDHDKLESK